MIRFRSDIPVKLVQHVGDDRSVIAAAKVSYPLWEIDQAARACEAEFARLFPLTHAAFVECGRAAP